MFIVSIHNFNSIDMRENNKYNKYSFECLIYGIRLTTNRYLYVAEHNTPIKQAISKACCQLLLFF